MSAQNRQNEIYKPGDFSVGQMHEFLGVFGRNGGTPDILQKGIDHPERIAEAIIALRGGEVPDLGLFASPEEQKEALKAANLGFSGEYIDKMLVNPPDPHEVRQRYGDPRVAVTIEFTLDTLQNTVEAALNWVKRVREQAGDTVRTDLMSNTDPKHLQLADGKEFTPWTLQWRVCDMGANCQKGGVCTESVRRDYAPDVLPVTAIYTVLATCERFVEAMDTKPEGYFIPLGVDIAGLKVRPPGSAAFEHVPIASRGRARRKLKLNAFFADGGVGDPDYCVSVFRE